MLTNTLTYHLMNNPRAGVCFLWELTVLSSAGLHVLLNLRRFAAQRAKYPSSRITNESSLVFVPRTEDLADRIFDDVDYNDELPVSLHSL